MPNLSISQLPEITATTSNAEYAVSQDGPTIPSVIVTVTQV